MDGVSVVIQLLTNHGGLTQLVPAKNIVPGSVPLGTVLPSVSVMSVSKLDNNIISPGTKRMVSERVSVLVQAKTVRALKAVMAEVRKAAADQMPIVSGLSDVVVHTESGGPDMTDGTNSFYAAPQDFRVRYNEVR